MQPASYSQRITGGVIDYALTVFIGTNLGNELYRRITVPLYVESGISFNHQERAAYVLTSFIFVFVLYFVVSERKWQKTLGKAIACTYVAKEGDKVKPTLVQILKRTVCRLSPWDWFTIAIQPIWWHDKISDTNVFTSENIYSLFYNRIKPLVAVLILVTALFMLFRYYEIIQAFLSGIWMLCFLLIIMSYLVAVIKKLF